MVVLRLVRPVRVDLQEHRHVARLQALGAQLLPRPSRRRPRLLSAHDGRSASLVGLSEADMSRPVTYARVGRFQTPVHAVLRRALFIENISYNELDDLFPLAWHEHGEGLRPRAFKEPGRVRTHALRDMRLLKRRIKAVPNWNRVGKVTQSSKISPSCAELLSRYVTFRRSGSTVLLTKVGLPARNGFS